MRLLECSWGEKENKRRGDRDRTLDTCEDEKNKKMKMKKRNETCMDENEMKEREIILKKNPNWKILPQYFHNKF